MRVLAIGIGAGDPEHLTLQAIRAIGECDVLFVVEKPGARDELAALRRDICARHATAGQRIVSVTDAVRDRATPVYKGAVDTWRDERRALWEAALRDELGADETGGFLVWGDPALYDSTIAILGEIGIDFDVIPGISSIQALAAQHQIPLNRVGGAVLITPGRLLREGWPAGATDVVVMLDASAAYRGFAGEELEIFWGAYVGTPDEVLVSGPLTEAVMGEIEEKRAAARERKGWVMDSYVLRRPLEAERDE
jgi:precorrin-6A synthase